MPGRPVFPSSRMTLASRAMRCELRTIPTESPRYGTMPRTTQCQNCGIILNLPANAPAGKRLKCPKCGLRFVCDGGRCQLRIDAGRPRRRRSDVSRFDIDQAADSGRSAAHDRGTGPAGDVRPPADERSGRRAGRGLSGPAIGDAASLLEDRAGPKRRMTAAEARSRARRCSNCGGLVPQGMSICVSCGVDQETGLRVGLDDDLIPPPPPRPPGPPLHVAIIGGLCGAAGLILLIFSLVRSVGGAGLAELWLALPGLGLGLRHLRLGPIHPAQVGQTPDGGLDPRRRDRRHGPGRHAVDPGQFAGSATDRRAGQAGRPRRLRHHDQATRRADRSPHASRSASPSS